MARSATDIQLDLDAAYASRRKTLQAQGYQIDSGQGSQRVERAKLAEINATINSLEAELESANDGGATHLRFDR